MVSRAMLTVGINGKEKSAELTRWAFCWKMAMFGKGKGRKKCQKGRRESFGCDFYLGKLVALREKDRPL